MRPRGEVRCMLVHDEQVTAQPGMMAEEGGGSSKG